MSFDKEEIGVFLMDAVDKIKATAADHEDEVVELNEVAIVVSYTITDAEGKQHSGVTAYGTNKSYYNQVGLLHAGIRGIYESD